jgi:hypothetical protein
MYILFPIVLPILPPPYIPYLVLSMLTLSICGTVYRFDRSATKVKVPKYAEANRIVNGINTKRADKQSYAEVKQGEHSFVTVLTLSIYNMCLVGYTQLRPLTWCLGGFVGGFGTVLRQYSSSWNGLSFQIAFAMAWPLKMWMVWLVSVSPVVQPWWYSLVEDKDSQVLISVDFIIM